MRKLKVNFDEIQKAMEDVARDAFDYFLDLKTGEVIALSEDILSRVRSILYKGADDESGIDEVKFNEEYNLPDWMEDEVELAIKVLFDEEERYICIPERQSGEAYTTMTNFLETITDQELKEELSVALNGKGAFARFKDVLVNYPKERKGWHGYNAKAMKKVIIEWLGSIEINDTDNRRQL